MDCRTAIGPAWLAWLRSLQVSCSTQPLLCFAYVTACRASAARGGMLSPLPKPQHLFAMDAMSLLQDVFLNVAGGLFHLAMYKPRCWGPSRQAQLHELLIHSINAIWFCVLQLLGSKILKKGARASYVQYKPRHVLYRYMPVNSQAALRCSVLQCRRNLHPLAC